jgi:hypothetical protein
MDLKNKMNSEKINRITNATLLQKTGKSWHEWFEVLNTAGAECLSHQKIAIYLSDKYQLEAWWAQMVTVGYEQYHGKRERHQKPNGYEISVSKTINMTLPTLYHAWLTEEIRKKWLPEPIIIRKATLNKSMRIAWVDKITNITVHFYVKGDSKSQVVVQHSKICDTKSAEEKKLFWKKALKKLCESLEN